MWSIAALVHVLERKGVLTQQEVQDAIRELRRQTPKSEQANPPWTRSHEWAAALGQALCSGFAWYASRHVVRLAVEWLHRQGREAIHPAV